MDQRRDVIVIGAGIVGAATAYELARRGVGVTLVEAQRPAWGASGRNPGFLWLHTRAPGTQMMLGLAGRALYEPLVDELDDFEFRPSGGMIYFFEEQADLFPAFVEERRRAGLPMELLDSRRAREVCPLLPERVAGATHNPLDAHIHTAKLVEALVRGAERAGAVVIGETPVLALDVANGRCRGVVTGGGALLAETVVLAAGVWTPELLRPIGLDLPLMPMRLQVVETEPAEVRFDPILYGPTAVKQYAFVHDIPGFDAKPFSHPLEEGAPGIQMLELVAQRRDGRVVLGCPIDFPGLDDRPTVSGVGLTLAVLAEHLPALGSLPVSRTWAGLLPETADALPVLGPAPGMDGLVLATGHVFGNLAGPISGRLIAQLLTDEEPDLALEPFRPDRPALRTGEAVHGRW